MKWLSRSLVGALAGATVATLAVAPQGVAAAEQRQKTTSTATDPAEQQVTRRNTVTLVTGDVVEVWTMANGRQVASVRPSEHRRSAGLQIREVRGDLYTVPDDAVPYIESGTLDRELFNVTDLIEQGYDDAHSSTVPLLVSYGSAGQYAARRNQKLPGGARQTLALPAINGAAWEAKKDQAQAFWTAMSGNDTSAVPPSAAAAKLAKGATKMWLSHKVRVNLAESVPQIGAPQAWAAGHDGKGVKVAVLDTGADLNHPDLAGKVVANQSFVPGESVADGHGHGTHVAATVAGTGAASGGSRKGVAPGADLMVGKVLNNAGSGQDAWIIAGMQWAVDQGAQVVSMSLGGAPSDGTDALSMAVNSLSGSSRTLFVIAAGNLLGGEGLTQNISSPGAADLALTVGAVSKSDVLADFSHVGPRLNDFAIKPEITAPGVGIIAARGAGTSLGTPVDDKYTSLNGTSMATPHVAGAAAIIAQEHPTWTGQQIKNALVSSAKPSADYTVYQQGGGRLDVAKAHDLTVRTSAAALDLGYFRFPHDGTHQPASKSLTYTNDSTQEVTLNLSAEARGPDGQVVPDMVSLSTSQVTVAPGGSAEVTLTVDGNRGGMGSFGGYLTASTESSSDGSVQLHTPFGATKEKPTANLTVNAIARDGRPAERASVMLWNLDNGEFLEARIRGGVATLRATPGNYQLVSEIQTWDEWYSDSREYTSAVLPELHLEAGDVNLNLDARTAVPVKVSTPKETETSELMVQYFREVNGVRAQYVHENSRFVERLFAIPTKPVSNGQFEFSTQWALTKPDLKMRISTGNSPLIVHDYMGGGPKLDGRRTLPVVDAGDGSAAALAAVDVRGKIALMRRSDDVNFTAQVTAAGQAGAAFAVVSNYEPGRLTIFSGPTKPIPAVTISQADGQAILAALAKKKGKLSLDLDATANSPYVYDLLMPESGRIPDRMNYTVGGNHKVAQVDLNYYSHSGQPTQEAIATWRPWSAGPFFIAFRDLPAPFRRTQYISANNDGTTWRHFTRQVAEGPWLLDEDASYKAGEHVTRDWFKQVVRPGIPDRVSPQAQPSYRDGDTFRMTIWPFLDSDSNHFGELSAGSDWADTSAAEFYQDGQFVLGKRQAQGAFPAAADAGHEYRLTLKVGRETSWWTMSTQTDTAWTFKSDRPAAGTRELLPLLQVDYDLPVDLNNAAREGKPFVVGLRPYHQAQLKNGPAITDTKLWVSYDDGKTWAQTAVSRGRDGQFSARYTHPAAKSTSGFVSLKVQATDAAGNRIEQTITRAYGLATQH